MSIKLFPIGYLTASTESRGAWAVDTTATNYFFEPNMGCQSNQNDTTLTSEMENHSLVTRQKIPIFRNVAYSYEDIWAKEFEVIDRFYTLTDGRAGRFYVIDLSQQEKATTYQHAAAAAQVTANIPDTHRFNTTAGKAGYWAAAWKPVNASILVGKMVSKSTDTSITFTASYGDLKTNSGLGDIYIYPVLNVLFGDTIANFESGEFVPTDDDTRGYMKSGNVTFLQYGAD